MAERDASAKACEAALNEREALLYGREVAVSQHEAVVSKLERGARKGLR